MRSQYILNLDSLDNDKNSTPDHERGLTEKILHHIHNKLINNLEMLQTQGNRNMTYFTLIYKMA